MAKAPPLAPCHGESSPRRRCIPLRATAGRSSKSTPKGDLWRLGAAAETRGATGGMARAPSEYETSYVEESERKERVQVVLLPTALEIKARSRKLRRRNRSPLQKNHERPSARPVAVKPKEKY